MLEFGRGNEEIWLCGMKAVKMGNCFALEF